jgi:DNA invertase Pin-like site-specific DNA recombinase
MFTMVRIPKMVALGQSFLQSTAQSCDRCLRTELFRFERSAVAEFERTAISKRTKKALAAAKAKGNALGNYHRIDKAKQAAEAVRPMITETVPPLDAGCRRRAKPTRPHDSYNPRGAHQN